MASDLPEALQVAGSTFDMFDKDRDGLVTKSELSAVLKDLDPETWTADALSELWEKALVQADQDGDGSLNIREFLSWLSSADGAGQLTLQSAATSIQLRDEGGGDVAKTLKVTVKGAANLRNADFSLFAGKSDPYVVVEVLSAGGDCVGEPQRTTVKENELNPVWNEDFVFEGRGSLANCKLRLRIYDEDSHAVSLLRKLDEDDFLGEAEVILKDFRNDGKSKDFTLPLAKGQGSLSISLLNTGWGEMPLLEVHGLSAAQLRDSETARFRRFGDAAHAFAVLEMGASRFKTTAIPNSLNPTWEEKWVFAMRGGDHELALEVFDQDLLNGDDALGRAVVSLVGLEVGKKETRTVSLGNDGGEVKIELCTTSVPTEVHDEARKAAVMRARQQLDDVERDRLAAEDGAGDILTFSIIGAHGLNDTDRGLFRRKGDHSDPYVMVFAGGEQYRSEVVKNCLDPVWQTDMFHFTVEPGSDPTCRIEVYDSDWLVSDELLGKLELDSAQIAPGRWHRRKEVLKTGSGAGEADAGSIEFRVRRERQPRARLQRARQAAEKLAREQDEAAALAREQAEAGAGDILTIVVLAAHGLQNTERGLFRRSGDCSDPYVFVSTDKQTFRSKTLNNTLEPVWDSEPFEFTLGPDDTSVVLEAIDFTVYDSDLLTFDDRLGKTTLHTDRLEAGQWHTLTQSLGAGNGELDFKVRIERQPRQRVGNALDALAALCEKKKQDYTASLAGARRGAGLVVYVQVLAGHGLKETVGRLLRMMGDHSDPYVKVTLGDATLMTDIINNDLNPTWAADVFKFETPGNAENLSLNFECWDSDFFTHDDPMGAFAVDMGAVEPGAWLDMRKSLGEGNGELSFKLRVEKQPKVRLDKTAGERLEMWEVQQELREQRRKEALAAKK